MIKKKICMLGAFAVGKTSLVSRYVESLFSEDYLTTVGVKVDTRLLVVRGMEVQLVIWDIAGEDDVHQINLAYLRGASGYLVVVDGTRPETVDVALEILERSADTVGALPHIVCVNKSDLDDDWAIDRDSLAAKGVEDFVRVSAKTGEGVERAFERLAELMIEGMRS